MEIPLSCLRVMNGSAGLTPRAGVVEDNMSTTNARLNRQTFSISRELEYFSEAELTTQTGYGKDDWWPGVVAKELIDNSLDACEQAGTPPRMEVDFQGDSLTVADNGPGLHPDVLERILDFG